ncbi:protein cornichon homolog 4-like isoform X2 [Orbicella faveolata]|uniref:protein cornichon homolog 4-like isoform X2 n=1 Tax=Orbicella faveolata TaxID=48498 RepID=UPI0009E4DE51|nr:protein cornichon homolog 4-like isoform X2 [Orbicella faveolata]
MYNIKFSPGGSATLLSTGETTEPCSLVSLLSFSLSPLWPRSRKFKMSESALYIFGLIDGAALLFLSVYFIINLSDLECDYINATTCCRRLNVWIFFLLNAPLLGWLVYRYVNKPAGNLGLYDPAEIHNRHELKAFLKEAMIKLGFHLVFFFLYLYSMIAALLDDNKSKTATS